MCRRSDACSLVLFELTTRQPAGWPGNTGKPAQRTSVRAAQ